MEKKNSFVVIIIIVNILIIGIVTSLKVYNNHIDNIYKVINKKICESASKCYIDNKCEGKTIKIKELISNNYLENQVDPKTKEYISEDITVYYDDGSCQVDIK